MAEATEALTRGNPVEPRSEEWRMAEPPADGEPPVEAIAEFALPAVPGTLDEDERRRRSELAIALRPRVFPAQRDALVHLAMQDNAPQWILDALERLPVETRFDTVQEVWLALGGREESRATSHPAPSGPTIRADDEIRPSAAASAPVVRASEQPTAGAPGREGLLQASLELAVGIGISAAMAAVGAVRCIAGAAHRVLTRGTA